MEKLREKLMEKSVFFWEFLGIKPTIRLFFILLIICLILQPLDILSTQLFFQRSGLSVVEERNPIVRWVLGKWGIDWLYLVKSFLIILLVIGGVLTLRFAFKYPQRKEKWTLLFTEFAFITCLYLLVVIGNFLFFLLEIDIFAQWNFMVFSFLERIL